MKSIDPPNTTCHVTTTQSLLPLTIGTRESQLAMVQAHSVHAALSAVTSRTLKINGMTTLGDQILDRALSKIGQKALFTKELEVALEVGTVDLIVHSLKGIL